MYPESSWSLEMLLMFCRDGIIENENACKYAVETNQDLSRLRAEIQSAREFAQVIQTSIEQRDSANGKQATNINKSEEYYDWGKSLGSYAGRFIDGESFDILCEHAGYVEDEALNCLIRGFVNEAGPRVDEGISQP